MMQLLKHPNSPARAARSIELDAARVGSELRLAYVLRGDVDAIAWPPPASSTRTDELWRHTCFEAFVRLDSSESYYEFNFAPSRQWAAYRFDSYRAGMTPAYEFADPRIEIVRGAESFGLNAVITLPPGVLKLAASAVVEEKAGGLSYWALKHAPDKPDFHHADGFVLELR
ncbi:MAG: DOMON-like domain-containing protein [Hyphomonadaceae bacterium]|nr:DOMON-like domain-containing protein [Hyphomonadaceae bacterium]